MDMISMLEIQDGIAAYKKLEARLREVAIFMATYEDKIVAEDPTPWRVKAFWISDKSRGGGPEPMTTVHLFVPKDQHRDHKSTDDWEEEEGYDNVIHRYFNFPTRYLYTEGWEDEVASHRLRITVLRKERDYETYANRIAEREVELPNMKAKLAEMAEDLRLLKELSA